MKDRLFRDILPGVSKPARYTGGELNMIKKDWDRANTRMLFAFPDVYEVGMSHVGGKILYGLVNEKSKHILERAFAPWPDMEEAMRNNDIPLYSLESFRPAKDFDVIGFSLQYELSITNVLNMLDMAGVPVKAADRRENDPLVVAGGPVVFNPEPFAAFFDAIMVGDGEEVMLEFLDCCYENRNKTREELLLQAARIEGVYIPSLYQVEYNPDKTFNSITPLKDSVPQKIRKRVVQDLDKAYFPEKPILPYMNIVHDRAVVEVMRGCQRGCRFCHAGMVYRPVRERSTDTIKAQAQAQLESTGYDEISITSLSTLDYSCVGSLVTDMVNEYGEKGTGVSLPSLRVDAFSIDLANEVQKVRKTTLTLAPEAGTQRMRDIINKNVTEEQLLEAVESAFKSGWLGLKLYFMFGLPGEREEDLEGILNLVEKVKAIGDKYGRRKVEIRVSLACFVPKAHTPFQWQPQNSIEELESKQKMMSSRKRKRIKLSFHDSYTSFLEGVIARGDRRVGEVILKAWEKGCTFDGWSEYFDYTRWEEAFAETGINPEFYTLRERPYDEKIPWDFIDTGISSAYLQKENENAKAAITTSDCRWEKCTGCGVCKHFGVDLDIKGGTKDAPESRVSGRV